MASFTVIGRPCSGPVAIVLSNSRARVCAIEILYDDCVQPPIEPLDARDEVIEQLQAAHLALVQSYPQLGSGSEGELRHA
jgi:hypothetical protein